MRGGTEEEGKRKNRPWQQIDITAHVTGCTVTVSVPFSNRIAASPRSRVLTIQQNRTFLLLSLSMFRDFSPRGFGFVPFSQPGRMDLSFSCSCARMGARTCTCARVVIVYTGCSRAYREYNCISVILVV